VPIDITGHPIRVIPSGRPAFDVISLDEVLFRLVQEGRRVCSALRGGSTDDWDLTLNSPARRPRMGLSHEVQRRWQHQFGFVVLDDRGYAPAPSPAYSSDPPLYDLMADAPSSDGNPHCEPEGTHDHAR
jgi:hypothetical protein